MKGIYTSTQGKKKMTRTERKLRQLAKNGRDYSKPTLNDQLTAARESLGKKKPKLWYSVVSVPMGGAKK